MPEIYEAIFLFKQTPGAKAMQVDTSIAVVFLLLVLIGSFYSYTQKCMIWAVKNGLDPTFGIPPVLFKNPRLFAALPMAVWILRFALFFLVLRIDDITLGIIAVIGSWFTQRFLSLLYPGSTR